MTSEIEKAILDSTEPIMISDEKAKEIMMKANGEKVILLNKQEIDDWIGPIPINDYPINKDPAPLVVTKKPKPIETKQQVSVKYLEPPPVSPPGEIIIQQEANKLPPVAPPLIIRQVPEIPSEPEALVIRELPPEPPKPPPKKIITIAGKLLPPPPRKVIIEKLPELPDKRPDIILERWLPYKDVPRKITLVPKPTEVEETIQKEDDRKYSVQAPIFINPPLSPPFLKSNLQSNYISPIPPQTSITPINPSPIQSLQTSQSILNHTTHSNHQNPKLKQSNSKLNNTMSSSLFNNTFSIPPPMPAVTALSSLPPGLQSVPTLSNFSLLQQSGLPSALLPPHLQSAFSTNPSIFPSPSQSSFISSPFIAPNFIQQLNYFPNNFSGYFPPPPQAKKLNTFQTTFYNPFMQK